MEEICFNCLQPLFAENMLCYCKEKMKNSFFETIVKVQIEKVENHHRR